MADRLAWLRPRSVRARIALMSIGLLVLVQLAVWVALRGFNERIAEAHADAELKSGEAAFARLLRQDQARLEIAASVLASDFAFREAVATGDLRTLASALQNHGSRVRADVTMLVSPDGRVIADTQRPGAGARDFPFPDLIEGLSPYEQASGVVTMRDGRPYQLVVVPVLAPDPIARIAFGFIVDAALARELRALARLDVVFMTRRGVQPWRPAVATVDDSLAAELARAAVEGAETATVDRRAFRMRLVHVSDARDGVAALLVQPLDSTIAPFERQQRALALVALASLAAFALGAARLSRSIAQPLLGLASAAQRIRAGDTRTPVGPGPAGEIGELADSLEHMRRGIAEREARILALAYTDALTGLPNRTLLRERLGQALAAARDRGATLGLVALDLDRFRGINDTLGHESGDRVLQAAARRLEAATPGGALLARLDGDQFAVMLPDADVEAVRVAVNMLTAALAEPIVLGDQPVDACASAGAAMFPAHGALADDLLRHADVATRAAKRQRTTFAFYDPASNSYRQEHLSLLSELRRAMDRDELELHYQPQVSLRSTDQALAAEVLLRWRHPVRGMVPPSEFVPFAEHTGYIRTVTRWVLDRAIAQSAAWRAAGRTIKLSVNVSARDLESSDLSDYIGDRLASYGVPASLFRLEVTESAIMNEPEHAISAIAALRARGLRMAIDDFGTGFSSLAYLRRLAASELKIDRSFIAELGERDEDSIIVRSTIELGHSLGLDIVAEGVESPEQAAMLRRFGCDRAQGFLYARPMSATAYEAWLERRERTAPAPLLEANDATETASSP